MQNKNLLLITTFLLFSCNNTTSSSNGKHQVIFKNGNEILKTLEVNHGENALFNEDLPTKESTDKNYIYDFIGWDHSLKNIQSDLVINAIYQVIKDEEIEDGDFLYRPIYDESISSLTGYELRFYNNLEFEGDLIVPSQYNNLPILRIGEACFMDTLISNISLPETIKVIDAYAFNSCENLQSLNIPNECKILKNAAIFYDNNLTNISLNNLEFIGTDNFHICPKLESLSINENNINFTIENNILYNYDFSSLIKVPEHLSNVTINNQTTKLEEEALSRLNNVTKLIIPESIETISKKAFFESRIEEITIEGNITTIEDQTFSHCINLKKISLPNTIEIINYRAFYHCEKLEDISLPDTLKSIGDFSFAYCYNLKDFYIPSSLNNIGYGALDGQDSLTRFTINDNNKSFKVFDDCLYSSDYSKLIRVPQTKDSIIYHEDVKIIGSGAFYKCQEFTEFNLPDDITTIEDYAFYFVNTVYHLNIPDSVLTIGEGAFQNMEILVDIHLPINLTIIEKNLFDGCPLLQEVNIPYKVTEIKDNAFFNCINLPSLTLSKNITSFGKDTFAACNMLDLINYEGSQSDWSKIKNRDISGLSDETEIVFDYQINK